MDFPESDPQTRESYSLPTHEKRGDWQVALAWSTTFAPPSDLAYNSGPGPTMTLVAPKGSLLNPEPGCRWGTARPPRSGCWTSSPGPWPCPPRPDPGRRAGQASIMVVQLPDLETGEQGQRGPALMAARGPAPTPTGSTGSTTPGASSGTFRPRRSVRDADHDRALRALYRLHGGRLVPGGAGVEVEVKIFPPNASVASRAMERYHFGPGAGPAASPVPPARPASTPTPPVSGRSGRSTSSTWSRGTHPGSAPRAAEATAIRSIGR